jgi:hypothetical protein
MAKDIYLTKKVENNDAVRTIEMPDDRGINRSVSVHFDQSKAENGFAKGQLLSEVVEGDYIYTWSDAQPEPLK